MATEDEEEEGGDCAAIKACALESFPPTSPPPPPALLSLETRALVACSTPAIAAGVAPDARKASTADSRADFDAIEVGEFF